MRNEAHTYPYIESMKSLKYEIENSETNNSICQVEGGNWVNLNLPLSLLGQADVENKYNKSQVWIITIYFDNSPNKTFTFVLLYFERKRKLFHTEKIFQLENHISNFGIIYDAIHFYNCLTVKSRWHRINTS